MNTIKSTNHDEMIPFKFHLSQNYPNPFKDKTKIKYCVAFKTMINISVFNSKGQIIKNLIDEVQDAGTYEIEFSAKGGSAYGGNAASLPDGIYYYQINTVDYLETKQMILKK